MQIVMFIIESVYITLDEKNSMNYLLQSIMTRTDIAIVVTGDIPYDITLAAAFLDRCMFLTAKGMIILNDSITTRNDRSIDLPKIPIVSLPQKIMIRREMKIFFSKICLR